VQSLSPLPRGDQEPDFGAKVKNQISVCHTSKPVGEPSLWGSSRSITLVVVVALHLALIALLVMGSRTSRVLASTNAPIELIFLPPMNVPKLRIDNGRPRHLSPNLAISVGPPMLNSPFPSAPSSGTNGGGPGVNWAAEAHRAIKAFEIRRDQPARNATLGSSPWDGWWPPRPHRAGDRFKTESGDWIVWINANCYEVASWHAGAPAHDATPPQTFCIADPGAPTGDASDRTTTNQSPPPKQ
jgi:hypothetical protein